MPATCSSGQALRFWRGGLFVCWRQRLRRPRSRLVGWRFCRRRSAIRSCKIGTRRSVCWRLRRCRSCLRRRRLRRRTRLRSCLGMSSSATGSLRVAPTSWRISCARLSFMLADAGAAVLISASRLRDRLDAPGVRRLELDREGAAIAAHPPSAPAGAVAPHNLAYVIYTSGSTGTPKGVAVEHASLANKILTLGRDFNVGSSFRSALVISCAFDASIEQALLPLIGGGTAVVISDAIRESPAQFWHQLIRDDVTFMSCVPSYLESVIPGAPDNAALHHLVLGGEVFTAAFEKEILRHLEVARITNLYGPTEAAIDAIGFAVDGEQSDARIPIGRPLPN